jgi:hypothetical protein
MKGRNYEYVEKLDNKNLITGYGTYWKCAK